MIRTPWIFPLFFSVPFFAFAFSSDGGVVREVFARGALAVIGLALLVLAYQREKEQR